MVRKKKLVEKLRKFTTLKQKLFKQYDYTCQICDYSIKPEVELFETLFNRPTTNKQPYLDIRSLLLSLIQIHHIVFKKDGGSNNLSNLIVLCKECHEKINSFDSLKSGYIKGQDIVETKPVRKKAKVIARKLRSGVIE